MPTVPGLDDARGAALPVGRRAARPDAFAPDGSEIRLLATDAQGATRASLCEVVLPAGQVSRPVWHRSVEEIWYVLEGAGDVWRAPPSAPKSTAEATGTARTEAHVPVSVRVGDAVVIPTGWRFQFRAAPDQALRFLCFTAPPWPGSDEAQLAAEGGLGQPTL